MKHFAIERDLARVARRAALVATVWLIACAASAGTLTVRIGHAAKPGFVEPIFLGDKPVTLEQLQKQIGADLGGADAQVLADPSADFSTVDKVMEILQLAGAGTVSLKREALPASLAAMKPAAPAGAATSAGDSFIITFRPQASMRDESPDDMAKAFERSLPQSARTHHLVFQTDDQGPIAHVVVEGRAGADAVRKMLEQSDRFAFGGIEPATPIKIEMLENILKRQQPAELPAERREPPSVTSILPDPGDDEVSVTLDAIRVTFDQDMDTSHAWVGGGPDFPPLRKGERPRWIDKRTCIYPAALKAGKFYRLQANSKTARGFRSANGLLPAEPALIYFVTQGADLETIRRGLRPQVVRMEPDSGDGEVDPALRELRVTFNVPMRPGNAFVGSGEHYPETPSGEEAHWTADKLTCILPVRLEGDWEYQLSVNGNGRDDFQSEAGVPLDPIFWTFQTKKAVAAAGATSSTLSISADPRIELISVIFRLAGHPEYSRGAIASYNDDVERWFGGRKQHPAVQLAQKLRGMYGVTFDAPMSLAIRMPQAMSDLVGNAPWAIDREGLDARWPPKETKEFCELARQFAQVSRFDKFFADHGEFYKQACDEARGVIERDVRLDWFDKFFGARAGADFRIVIAPLNGGGNYGPSRRLGGREEMYCILGIWYTDRYGAPTFTREASGVVAHEFNHSYSNPVVFRHMAELRTAGEVLFKPVAAKMQRQAYSNWQSMMIESLVRAAQVRYVREVRGAMWGQQAMREEINRGFTWTPGLVDLFDEYQKDRKTYPTLDSFFPRIVAFFNETSKKAPDKTKPMIVELVPADGATNVDPKMSELRVTFDRPMAPGASWVGGGASFPQIPAGAKFAWSADRKTCALPVKLEAGTEYSLSLNSFFFRNFQDPKGVALDPVEWKFRTKE